MATFLKMVAQKSTNGQEEVSQPGSPGMETTLSPKARIADAVANPAVIRRVVLGVIW